MDEREHEEWMKEHDKIYIEDELERAARVDRLAEIAQHVLFEAHRAGRFAEINATHSDVELISFYMFTSARIDLKAALSAHADILDKTKKLSDSADCT